MNKTRTNCWPTACYDALMSGDGTFLTKELITKECVCNNTSICKQLIDLLSNKKVKEAYDLLDNIYNNENKNNVSEGY